MEPEDWEEMDRLYGHSPPLVSEGSECPTCHRRVPHKKKPSSPQTKVVSIRVPIDDADTFKEMLDATSQHLGLAEKPHSNYWTVVHCLVLGLQANGAED